ncbi:MAG: DNA polymerase IV [Hyphomonadaceae bacterium]|nr:DNA polymerase IV [Hyphomonadaceae bacterium]
MNLCRACGAWIATEARCNECGERRIVAHPELQALSLAHVDCDAFYASIEKRDNPALAAQPVIVGGGKRGVVSTACYLARGFGVRAAMPMFKALKLCPHAVIAKPRMEVYASEGRAIREMMRTLTPQVEPLSIDEAFLDLSGTEQLHKAAPAQTLAKLQGRIEAERGLTVSIGLSFNKFLAKTASDLDKPRGFSVIGRKEALDFLAPRAVGTLPGVGPASAASLKARGLSTIGQIRAAGADQMLRWFGDWGRRLHALSLAEDPRVVDPDGERKSISAETTFFDDIKTLEALEDELWPLCEKVAVRARASQIAGRTLTLKIRDAQFRTFTRRSQFADPTLLAARIFEEARRLLAPEVDGFVAFRLIGVGLSDFVDGAQADKGDLLDTRTPKIAAAEGAVAAARDKFGAGAVVTGRTLKGERGE